MDDFENEIKNGFLEEAQQLLAETEQCYLSLESNPNDISVLEKIFRLAHNLKGSSKAVGFDDMGHFTHVFESVLLKIKIGDLKVTPDVVSLLLRCNDHLNKFIEVLKNDFNAKLDSTSLISELEDILSGKSSENTSEGSKHTSSESNENSPEKVAQEETISLDEIQALESANASFSAELSNENILDVNTSSHLSSIQPAPVAQSIAHESVTSSPQNNKSVNPTTHNQSNTTDESIRVNVSRIEKLQNFIGEMAILQAVLREQAGDNPNPLLRKTIHQMGKVSKEIQDISMSLRMVPIKPTFQKMLRIVRDTAQALNKDIQLNLIGEETELDKTVLEHINDPLVHLVRNAADHGIESTEKRIATGKNPRGTVTLGAYHQSGRLVIEIKDDGGGMDPQKLKAVAIKKGILKSGNEISDKEAYKLIFASGFSTKEQTTDISGRGVGMDVVRTNIEAIAGEIQIDSKLGTGTTFKIILPLTMAIIDGMTVRVGNERFVIPLAHIHESVSPSEKDLKYLTGVGDVMILRTENIPVFKAATLLGRKCNLKPTEMIAIVCRTGEKPFAILVDDIIGQYQIVVKQLGKEVQHIKGFSGSTILGDGRPALILEPLDLALKEIKNTNRPSEFRKTA